MKRTSIILFLIAIFYSCEENNKRSISDLEEASLASGIRVDTLFDDFYFGMPEWQIKQNTVNNDYQKYRFKASELKKYNFNIYSSFFNDSLYQLRFVVYKFEDYISEYSLESIVNLFTLKYNKPDTAYTIKDDGKISYNNIWLKGNLKIEVSYSEDKYKGLSISYIDLSRKTHGKNIVSLPDDYSGTVYTKEYYDNVYLTNKKKEVERSEF